MQKVMMERLTAALDYRVADVVLPATGLRTAGSNPWQTAI